MTITQQQLESGAVKHTGWKREGRDARQDAIDCDVNVLDYFDMDGQYLGPDENGLEPTFATRREHVTAVDLARAIRCF